MFEMNFFLRMVTWLPVNKCRKNNVIYTTNSVLEETSKLVILLGKFSLKKFVYVILLVYNLNTALVEFIYL